RLHMRQQIADPGAVLAAAAPGPHGGDDGVGALAGGHAGEALIAFYRGWNFLAIETIEIRLVIEQIDVGEAAGLVETEDALGLGGEVGQGGEACTGRASGTRSAAG